MGAGVADGRDGAGVGEVDGSLGETGPGDDGVLGVDVLEVEEAPPVVLVGSALDVPSAPCEKVPRLGGCSRSSRSA